MPTIQELQKKHFSIPDIDLLLAHAINKPREFLYTYPKYPISIIQYFRFRYYLWQRKRGVPLAYITGHKEFYGLDFLVNKHTLVPRPETELLVENAIVEIKKLGNKEIILIDVGTGSGCIPISISKAISQFPNFSISTLAIDISRPALRMARKNAKRRGVDITFLHGNLLSPITKILNQKLVLNEVNGSKIINLIITANLPYGWLAWKNESSAETKGLKFEPNKALFTGDSGLELIKKLLVQIKSLISKFLTAARRDPAVAVANFSISVFLEHDPRQTELLTKYISETLPKASVDTKTDLAGRERLTIITIHNRT